MTLQEAKRLPSLFIDDAYIFWLNFSGNEKGKNRKGDRNFCIEIPDEEMVQALTEDRWNVKIRPPREEGDKAINYIQVAVNWDERYPHLDPKIIQISGINGTETDIDESMVSTLDQIEMEDIKVKIRPRAWTDDETGEVRIKAYLAELRFVEVPRDFRTRYRH